MPADIRIIAVTDSCPALAAIQGQKEQRDAQLANAPLQHQSEYKRP